MPARTISRDIAASADAIWALLADFGDVSWIPAAGTVEVNGHGPGMSRKIFGSGDTATVETLIWIEPDHKRLAYTVTDSPLPVARFETVVSVTTAAEHGATCRIVFDVDYQPKDDDSSARESVDMVYGLIGDWLEEAATSTN